MPRDLLDGLKGRETISTLAADFLTEASSTKRPEEGSWFHRYPGSSVTRMGFPTRPSKKSHQQYRRIFGIRLKKPTFAETLISTISEPGP